MTMHDGYTGHRADPRAAAGTGSGPATDPGPVPGDTTPMPVMPEVTTAADEAGARRGRPPRPFVAAVDRVNRVLLVVLGLICLAGGVVALLAGFGALGTDVADRPTLTSGNRAYAAEHGWFWPVVGVVAGLIAVGGVLWLAAQFRTGRLRGLHSGDNTLGVHIDAAALTDAVQAEIEGVEGVRRVGTGLYRTREHPLLRIAVTAEPAIDVAALRGYLEYEVLTRARQAIDRPDLAAQIELRLAAARHPRRAR